MRLLAPKWGGGLSARKSIIRQASEMDLANRADSPAQRHGARRELWGATDTYHVKALPLLKGAAGRPAISAGVRDRCRRHPPPRNRSLCPSRRLTLSSPTGITRDGEDSTLSPPGGTQTVPLAQPKRRVGGGAPCALGARRPHSHRPSLASQAFRFCLQIISLRSPQLYNY